MSDLDCAVLGLVAIIAGLHYDSTLLAIGGAIFCLRAL